MRAAVIVDSLLECREALLKKGATIIVELQLAPTGLNMFVRHPDGTLIEYIEWSDTPRPVERDGLLSNALVWPVSKETVPQVRSWAVPDLDNFRACLPSSSSWTSQGVDT